MNNQSNHYDVIIIGAGAAGLFCGLTAGERGRKVLILDHAKSPGEKIRISGGGRCNFTNLHTTPADFLSANPHFCKSALSNYTPYDFIALVDKYGIAWHEKTLGQLFCDGRSWQIIDLLLAECRKNDVTLQTSTEITTVTHREKGYSLETTSGPFSCDSLVIASGGKSIPKMGATGFGYQIARQFGLQLIDPRPGLVPLSFDETIRTALESLSGISVEAEVRHGRTCFSEALLFTHRGLSGPAILQISSYWHEGEQIRINLVPGIDIFQQIKQSKQDSPKRELKTALANWLPKRLAYQIASEHPNEKPLGEMSDKVLRGVAERINDWRVTPSGTEGYRIAEVTVGGVDTAELSSKTFESKKAPGLYFIGEVIDVTGHLGGFNFQWAWASGFAAGQYV